MNPDGSDRKILVADCRLPDGIAVDAEASHIYWTNMGNPKVNDGSIERADLDGRTAGSSSRLAARSRRSSSSSKRSGKLYWCDREGMRVMRANLDGSQYRDARRDGPRRSQAGPGSEQWCVGIAIDPVRSKFYWTPEGSRQWRARAASSAPDIEIPKGETPPNRSRHRSPLRPPAGADRSRTRSRPIACSTGPTAATRPAAIP